MALSCAQGLHAPLLGSAASARPDLESAEANGASAAKPLLNLDGPCSSGGGSSSSASSGTERLAAVRPGGTACGAIAAVAADADADGPEADVSQSSTFQRREAPWKKEEKLSSICLSLLAWAAVLMLAGTTLIVAVGGNGIGTGSEGSASGAFMEPHSPVALGSLGVNTSLHNQSQLDLNSNTSWSSPPPTAPLEPLEPINLGVVSAAASLLGFIFTLALVTACLGGCIAGLQYGVVKAVEASIERFDRDYLGTDIEIGNMSFNLFTGRLEVEQLEMMNPEGFSEKGVVSATHFVFDIDVIKTLSSGFKEIEITELMVEGITANLEFDGYFSGKSNVQTVLDFLNNADLRVEGHIQPVYAFWHAGNHEHTFHCAPAWPGEVAGDQVFFAPLHEVPLSKPVYDFWSFTQREHIFRLGDQHSMLEKKGSEPVFYAFETMVPGTEPVYQFWHPGNKEHTIHFEPAWPMEERGELLFFAYREHPDGTSKARRKAATKFEPVYDFWHHNMQQHTFHMRPAWGGEKQGKLQFYAHNKHEDGLIPVYDFWHESSRRKRFHTGEARKGEERRSPLFYVHETQVNGTEPVFEFFHEQHNEYNIHMGPPWRGEVKQRIAFYAHREIPSMFRDLKINLRRVELIDITATSSTRLAGMKVNLGSLGFRNFSEQFQAFDAQSIVSSMVKQLFGKVSLGFA